MLRTVFIAACVLLSGCSLREGLNANSGTSASGGRSSATNRSEMSAPDYAPAYTGIPDEMPTVRRTVRPAPVSLHAPVPRPKPRMMDPQLLVGLTKDQVEDLIGPPGEVTDRPPSTVWTYRSPSCALDVFFYLDLSTTTFRALTWEMRQPEGGAVSAKGCLGQIREAVHDG